MGELKYLITLNEIMGAVRRGVEIITPFDTEESIIIIEREIRKQLDECDIYDEDDLK